MQTIALACETISDEINLSVEKIDSRITIRWIESGLHNSPEKLRCFLQSKIDSLENENRDLRNILLFFGYCGNALLGLTAARCRLIIPRVDDCISLLLGGNRKRRELCGEAMSYFLTRGWLRHENNLWNEYHYCLQKYGPKRTLDIYRLMLDKYKYLNVIKTGAYDPEDILPQTRELADALGLQHKMVEGSLDIIQKALLEEWDEDFAIIEPNSPVNLEALKLLPTALPQAGSGGRS